MIHGGGFSIHITADNADHIYVTSLHSLTEDGIKQIILRQKLTTAFNINILYALYQELIRLPSAGQPV